MKTLFRNKTDALLSKFRVSGGRYLTRKHINGTLAVKSGSLIVGTFVRMLPIIGLGTTQFRSIIIFNFIRSCLAIYSSQGVKGLVLWLKALTVITQQALAGHNLNDMTLVSGCRVTRTKSGLARVINRLDRSLIRKGDPKLMRFYLTLFNLYRVLEFPGKLKLHTIVNGFAGNRSRLDLYLRIFRYIPDFVQTIRSIAGDELISGAKLRLVIIPKSAPGTGNDLTSVSPLVLFMSARNLVEQGLDRSILYFATLYEKGSLVRYPGLRAIFSDLAYCALNMPGIPSTTYSVGKLGFKDEAAGKVRVFAMVDAWTNWVLRPLHEEIFRILKFLPTDGTFNQLGPIQQYTKWKSAFSLDLSAATDRLPIALQIGLLAAMYGLEFAIHWSKLLTDRVYFAYSKKYLPEGAKLRYGVGQPMGALSSWAMLALTHHFIVQCAAWEAGLVPVGTLYERYALLGDDLVVGDSEAKKHYLRILDALGVECGLHKSVLSPRGIGLEFAKRTLINGEDVSPIPIEEFLAANQTLPSALALAMRYSLDFPSLIKVLGYGYKVLGSLNKHIGSQNARVRALHLGFFIPPVDDPVLIEKYLEKGNPAHSSLAQLSPDIAKSFATAILKWVTESASQLNKIVVTDLIKSLVDDAVLKIWNRNVRAYLMLKDKALLEVMEQMPSSGDTNRVGTGPLDDPKTFELQREFLSSGNSSGTVNTLRDLILTVELGLTRLVTNMIPPVIRQSRDDLIKINSDLSPVRSARTAPRVYMWSLKVLAKMGAVIGVPSLFRVDQEVKPHLQVKQIKLWKLWSEALMKALK